MQEKVEKNEHPNGEKKLDENDFTSIKPIREYNWRLHEIRSALMLVVDNNQKSNAEREWPQVGLQPYTAEEQAMPHVRAVTAMLADEDKLNKALESVKRDFSEEEPVLVKKMCMEKALHQKIDAWRTKAGTHADLSFVLRALMNKDYKETHKDDQGNVKGCNAGLAGVWKTASATRDPHFLSDERLGNLEFPESYALVSDL